MRENEPPFAWLAGFRPKFDSLAKDRDRVADLIVALHDSGELPSAEGQSLYSLYLVDCSRWLEEAYFDRKLYDSIEAVHTATGEVAVGWPHAQSREVIERFVALGEAARARRMWRNHLALIKATYWSCIAHRDRGFRPMPGIGEPEDDQRRGFDAFVATIPEQKALLLEVMADARDLFVRAGAGAAELERLDRDLADVKAERRRPPEGKPDSRAMTEDLFWELIDGCAGATTAERLEALPERLARFKPTAIKAFDRILRARWDGAYRTDIWALAYLLRGGCSDDSFMDFRAWLILQGRDAYEGALRAPDEFDVSSFRTDSSGCLDLLEAPRTAYELRTGKPMPPARFEQVALEGPEIDEEEYESYLPRIAAAVSTA